MNDLFGKPEHAMYRQGDVLLVRLTRCVARFCWSNMHFKAVAPATAGVILAYGETTGHAHVLDKERVKPLIRTYEHGSWDAAAERFIQVIEKTALQHLDLPAGGTPTGEHADIELEPGVYKVIRQREWTSAMEFSFVAD